MAASCSAICRFPSFRSVAITAICSVRGRVTPASALGYVMGMARYHEPWQSRHGVKSGNNADAVAVVSASKLNNALGIYGHARHFRSLSPNRLAPMVTVPKFVSLDAQVSICHDSRAELPRVS